MTTDEETQPVVNGASDNVDSITNGDPQKKKIVIVGLGMVAISFM